MGLTVRRKIRRVLEGLVDSFVAQARAPGWRETVSSPCDNNLLRAHIHWWLYAQTTMTRQRTSSYVDSSEDDFAISDGGTSPQQSRLRRPRRPPKKPRQDAPRSPQTSSFHQVDSDDDVICVPDSLENQARQPSLDQHTSASKPNLDTSAENTMESIAESEQPASAGQVDSGKPNPREAHVHGKHFTFSLHVSGEHTLFVLSHMYQL